MLACREADDGRGRRWQPEVLHLDDRLPVDHQVMPASHLLPYVEQQRVVAPLGNIERSLKEVALAHFLLASLGRSDVDHLAAARTFTLVKGDVLVGRIKLRQAIVVPQQTIALARQEHGNGNLRVHLRQPPRKAAHIGIAVLKLTEAKEAFVLRRSEGQCGRSTDKLVAGSREDHLSGFVQQADGLPGCINAYLDICRTHLVVPDIEPVGQIAFVCCGGFVIPRFHILNAHGIACHSLYRQFSLSERHGLCTCQAKQPCHDAP